MGELRADWRLRLRREDAHGPICGAGVLVDQYTALTCAHVVRHPDTVMWLEFAENSGLEPVSARVLPGGWLPEGESGEDVAVLRLDSPRPQARRALLEPRLWGGLEVYATGYAEGFDDGMSLWGRIGGASGERVQLDAVTKSEVVRAGFSGAAVCTRPQEGRPARVVGLVVSWRGDLGELLPEANRISFSYLIPIGRIAELSPLIRELISPQAWDHDFEERLTRWFDDPDEDPVKITVVPPGSGKDRSLRHLLHRAHVVHRGGASRPDLVDHALDQVTFPAGEYLAYWDWLRGAKPPPAQSADRAPVRPVTVLVDGLDEEPRPGPLIELLARLRVFGFRLLLVFRHEGGPGWAGSRDRLLLPALLHHADTLLERLELVEFSRAIRRDIVDSASLGSVTETADRHRAARRLIDEVRDPQQQLARLRALIRALRADLSRHGDR
ncbi:trypsin-like peptidase domain-containing protein [Streptomyces sp. M2CJ-2]|uniref:S1 family peptidase n=1 Tax=Streptomyces sp. M2CJ-2 TaxID=2803948 RepID=UPI0019275BF2|nr:serine protease [Streptomyces sp. M2CJ-2]MBL3671171.1 trypsin-like peptidase domain-containing protein [Streptomyces sp. M2CJ-2]